ncbi:MAG TPA: acetolactate synthase small subunit [Fimbriimonas sp.]|nr:acetolactate synthase small subunit [Fimbriimonas sp.]
MSQHQHVVTALVQNEAGTINRLVSLFRRRGFSLASFNAGDCEDAGFSRLTLLVNGDDEQVAQCIKQLDKLIDVVECEDLVESESVSRELAFVRLSPTPDQREAALKVVSEFMGTTPRVGEKSIVAEIATSPAQIEQLIEALKPYNVVEVVRTGLVAIKAED